MCQQVGGYSGGHGRWRCALGKRAYDQHHSTVRACRAGFSKSAHHRMATKGWTTRPGPLLRLCSIGKLHRWMVDRAFIHSYIHMQGRYQHAEAAPLHRGSSAAPRCRGSATLARDRCISSLHSSAAWDVRGHYLGTLPLASL